MCANYWNLEDVTFKCLSCGKKAKDTLQTHFMGDASFNEYYRLGEPVPLLEQWTGSLKNGKPDDFVGQCDKCEAWHDFDAEIVNGVVVSVQPYRFESWA